MRLPLLTVLLAIAASCAAQPCMVGYAVTQTPQPTNGTYACGQTVTFCFTVTYWNSTNSNWFHGITASFGPGWDLATLTPGAPPPSCSGSGSWGWYNSVQGSSFTNIGPQGPGFFYNYTTPADGNPGNNFGDFCTGTVNWQFCWTISVLNPPACVDGMSLAVSFNTFGDSETGAWSGIGCGSDPIVPGAPAVVQACAINAGTSGTLTTCSSAAAQPLIGALGGSPQANGTWTGPGGGPHNGTLDPTTDPSGTYTYTVSSGPSCTQSATVAVTVNPQPDAGADAAVTLCASDAPVDLFGLLGPGADAGGIWAGPSGAMSGTFDPAVGAAGDYTYTVTGAPPCPAATATVAVSVNPSPNAGADGTLTVCSNAAAVDLFNALGGAPAPGGTWTGPGGAMSGLFDPAADAAGTYTYTVAGAAPCPSSSASVDVAVSAMPNAGTNSTASLCSTMASADLLALLNGAPDAGGSWTDPGGAAVAGIIIPATAASGTYTYTLPGAPPCPSASATLALTVHAQPDAGTAATVNLCSSSPTLDLFASLGGTPQPGGSWSGPAGAVPSGSFVPGASAPGAYTYTISAPAPCTSASATVTVSVASAISAGTDGDQALCSSAAPFNLINALVGNPSAGGTWTGPDGSAHGPVFNPAADAPGAYTYSVIGAPPCPSASSTVTMAVVQAPDAGAGGTVAICPDAAPLDPSGWLSGNPQAGGTWTAPGGGTITIVDPATAASGSYTYTVAGTPPCPAAQAVVQLTVDPLPNAGNDGTLSLCADGPTTSLLPLLGGAQGGGSWTGPAGASNGSFTPGQHPPGTYIYTVMGTGACSAATDQAQVIVAVNPLPQPSFTMDVSRGCVPLLIGFTNTTPGTLLTAGWSFGDGGMASTVASAQHLYVNPGYRTVTLTVTDINGCSGTHTASNAVLASSGPSASFSAWPLRVSVTNPTTTIEHLPEAGVAYHWSIGGTEIDTIGTFQWTFPRAEPGYQQACLTATDTLGCPNAFCMRILVDDDMTIWCPNAFTPNGDGLNEIWRPSVIGIEEGWYRLMVFDRWGQLVFSTEDPAAGWDGTMGNGGAELPQDVYVWMLKAKDQFTPEKADLMGTVTLLR